MNWHEGTRSEDPVAGQAIRAATEGLSAGCVPAPVTPVAPALLQVLVTPIVVVLIVVSAFVQHRMQGFDAVARDTAELVRGASAETSGQFLLTAVSVPAAQTTQIQVQDERRAIREAREAAIVAATSCVGVRRDRAELTIDTTGFRGDSAGLMLAVTIVDLLDPDDIAAGRRVAGTGTIEADGFVGGVMAVDRKAAAAERAGAEVFLVPADQAYEAELTTSSLRVVGVRDLDDALRALGSAGCR